MTGTVHNTDVTLRVLKGRRRGVLMALACGLTIASTGCSVMQQTHRTLRDEHVYAHSNKSIEKQMEAWADDAWLTHCEPNASLLDDWHYERGFKAGFARFLRTGNPNEPLLPPREYLKAKYVSWEGRNAINRWIQGHEVGSLVAAQSGLRELVKIPVLGVIVPDDNPLPLGDTVISQVVTGEGGALPIGPPPIPPTAHPAEDAEPTLPLEEEAPAPPEAAEADAPNFEIFDSFSTTPLPASDALRSAKNERTPATETSWNDTEPVEERETREAVDALTSDLIDDAWAALPEPADEDVNEIEDSNSMSFQWLENLAPDGDDPDSPPVENRSSESIEPERYRRTRPPETKESELWLFPPADSHSDQKGIGFPEPAQPRVVHAEMEERDTLPGVRRDAYYTRTSAVRRAQLYTQISGSTEQPGDAPAESTDQFDVDNDMSWPQLDKVMMWSQPE